MSSSGKQGVCPCGTGLLRGHCCGPYLAGEAHAPTAEALMRSRFVAYRDEHKDYLVATWHPDTRPVELAFDGDGINWKRLEVLETKAGGSTDDTGIVEFKAYYQSGHKGGVLHERSRFSRVDSRWLYIDGELSPEVVPAKKVGRNEPCPCGSGKKYKRCCGRGRR